MKGRRKELPHTQHGKLAVGAKRSGCRRGVGKIVGALLVFLAVEFLAPALFGAAFMMPSGFGITAYAAVDWEEDGGRYRCYDGDGDPVEDSWVKDGGKYYYIGEDGFMMTDEVVEDGDSAYYVGPDGAMVKNQWVFVTADMDYMNEWFYFGASGKACKDRKRKIGGRDYYFDENGCMLSGWQKLGANEELYYLGGEDEGYVHTGWQLLEPWEEMDGDYEEEEWFYFQKAGGKAYRDCRKQINRSVYHFDANGVTKDRWAEAIRGSVTTPGSAATPGTAASQGNLSGSAWADEVTKAAGKGWIYTYAPKDVHEEGEQYWFYLEKDGRPFNEDGKDSYYGKDKDLAFIQRVEGRNKIYTQFGAAARVIDKKTYLFDSEGRMLTGVYYLQGIKRKGGSDFGMVLTIQDDGTWFVTGEFYCFDKREGPFEGSMLTGKQTVEGENGEIYHYYLKKSGVIYSHSIVDGAYYDRWGLRCDAEGRGQAVIEIESGDSVTDVDTGREYTDCALIVNDAGRLKKNGSVTVDGIRYTLKDYIVIKSEPLR